MRIERERERELCVKAYLQKTTRLKIPSIYRRPKAQEQAERCRAELQSLIWTLKASQNNCQNPYNYLAQSGFCATCFVGPGTCRTLNSDLRILKSKARVYKLQVPSMIFRYSSAQLLKGFHSRVKFFVRASTTFSPFPKAQSIQRLNTWTIDPENC